MLYLLTKVIEDGGLAHGVADRGGHGAAGGVGLGAELAAVAALLPTELAAGRLPRLLPRRPAPPRHRARHAPGRCSASRAAAKLRVRVVVTT